MMIIPIKSLTRPLPAWKKDYRLIVEIGQIVPRHCVEPLALELRPVLLHEQAGRVRPIQNNNPVGCPGDFDEFARRLEARNELSSKDLL